jgi:hypothetical protein
MNQVVTTVGDFQREWRHNINFLLGGECVVPFHFKFPCVAELVDVVRNDPEARISKGGSHGKKDTTDISEYFRRLPIEEALRTRFSVAHFKISRFFGPGQILHGFDEQVMEPWRAFLRRAGFEWERCYPIIFISGPNSGTCYHMDFSHVVAWQVYGTKIFSGFHDPDRFEPIERSVSKEYHKQLKMPETFTPADVLAYTMKPGDVLWNQLLTPHWVDAGEEVAVSVNISHGMLRHHGQLCPNEQRVEEWWAEHPEEAWREGAGSGRK